MRQDIHQDHHQIHHQEGVSSIYFILGIILIMPIVWHSFGSDEIRKWHPFSNVEYSLSWYLVLTSYNLRPLLYVVVANLAKPRHHTLILCFIVYEAVLFLDHMMTYSQSPVYSIIPLILSTYMVWYHYKFENIGWI